MLEFVESKKEFCNIIHGTRTSKVAFEKMVELHAEFCIILGFGSTQETK